MYNEKIENLIKAALADGVLTEKEKQILFKNAQAQGMDLDEFEMVLDARLVELEKAEKEKAAKSAPKSEKYGDVRKCPVCGALVPALGVTCAECGYEFTGVTSSSSSQLLAKKIEEVMQNAAEKKNKILTDYRISDKIEKGEFYSPRQLAIRAIEKDAKSQIESILQNFPIPNAKNDLFDILLYLKNNIEEEAYEKKYKECLDRANILYPSDPILSRLKEEGEQVVNDKKVEKYGVNIMFITLFICTFGSFGVYYWWADSHDWGWTGWAFGWMLFLVFGELIGFLLGFILRKVYIKLNSKSKNK